jgi:hypothetical protein
MRCAARAAACVSPLRPSQCELFLVRGCLAGIAMQRRAAERVGDALPSPAAQHLTCPACRPLCAVRCSQDVNYLDHTFCGAHRGAGGWHVQWGTRAWRLECSCAAEAGERPCSAGRRPFLALPCHTWRHVHTIAARLLYCTSRYATRTCGASSRPSGSHRDCTTGLVRLALCTSASLQRVSSPAAAWAPCLVHVSGSTCTPTARSGRPLHNPLRAVAAFEDDDGSLIELPGNYCCSFCVRPGLARTTPAPAGQIRD